MLSEETDTGTAFIQGDADGVNGYGLRIKKKWRKLPVHAGSGHTHGPQYKIEVGYLPGRGYANTHEVSLSDRQMQELFHAWMVLRKEYADDNPSLVERDRKAEAHKLKQEEERALRVMTQTEGV